MIQKIYKFLKRIKFLILALVLVSVFDYGYDLYIVSGDSMDPSIGNNEVILIDKLSYDSNNPPRWGDVILFYDGINDEVLVKRIIGLPGDEVEIIDGNIYINGDRHVDEFSHIKLTIMLVDIDGNPLRNWETGERVYENDSIKYRRLEEGEYWVIGDNRRESWYGIVFEHEIIGKLYD